MKKYYVLARVEAVLASHTAFGSPRATISAKYLDIFACKYIGEQNGQATIQRILDVKKYATSGEGLGEEEVIDIKSYSLAVEIDPHQLNSSLSTLSRLIVTTLG